MRIKKVLLIIMTVTMAFTALPMAMRNAAAVGEPAIMGPYSLTLSVGYEATSTEAFTVAGDPAPTVTKTYGDAKITWNETTKRLDIAAGLEGGTYPVMLKAANGKDPDSIVPFSLRVETPGAPTITGPSVLTLHEGYEAVSTGVFTIKSESTPSISISVSKGESDTEFTTPFSTDKIKWNYTTKKLDIAPGLAVGFYGVLVRASNGKKPDGLCFFRLTIAKNGTPITAYPGMKTEYSFTDVDEDDWFYDATVYAFENGLMNGYSETNFGAGHSLTRAMIVTILYRREGEPDVTELQNPFNDVPETSWYTAAVKWAADNGIVLGYGDDRFGPEDMVTKEQLAVIIYRAEQASGNIPPDTTTDCEWPDRGKINDWAKPAVDALTDQGVFRDIPKVSFNPQTPATRAEAVSMLYRWLTAME